MPIQTISCCLASLWEARTAIDVVETRGYHHLSPCCHPWIVGSKKIGVQCWQPHQCHHCQIGPKAPSIPSEVDDVGRPEPTWKLIYPSLKMRMQRMLWPTRVGGGIGWFTIHAGCRDHTLLPYAIWSLLGYPGELVQSSGMDITLDDVLTILHEHYNNVKALDALNQELFQLWMADKETISDCGICLSRCLQVLAASFPDHFHFDHVAELKWDHFYGRLPKWLKQLWPTLRPAHMKRLIPITFRLQGNWKRKTPWSYPDTHGTMQLITLLNQKPLVSSLCRSSKGNQPVSKMATVCLAHLEEESTKRDEEVESKDPDSIDGVMEEFMVHLARAVKDTQVEEKCCYHCSSPEHFICDCPQVRALRENTQLNHKEGMTSKKGVWTPQMKSPMPKNPQEEVPKA